MNRLSLLPGFSIITDHLCRDINAGWRVLSARYYFGNETAGTHLLQYNYNRIIQNSERPKARENLGHKIYKTNKRENRSLLKKVFTAIIFIFFIAFSQAASITSTSTGGNWNSTSTWVGGVVPNSKSTDVVIAAGAIVTVNDTKACNKITGTTTTSILYIQSGGSLTMGTAVGGCDFKTARLIMSGGTFIVGHDFKPGVLTTATDMTGGTVEFLGNGGPGAFTGVTGQYYFFNVQIDAAATTGPGWDNSTINYITIQSNLTILSGGKADLPANSTHCTAQTLTFISAQQNSGTWGSTSSSATNRTNTYFTSTAGILDVATGAAIKGVLTTQPSGAVNGVALTTQPVVQLQDASNNNVSTAGVNVVASIASGTGVLGGTTTVATNASGIATFTNLVITGTAGNFTLAFTPTSLTAATSNQFALTAGAAIKGVLTTQPSGAVNGVALTTQPIVRLQDASNNNVSTAGVNVVASIASGTGVLGGTTTVATNASGIATFTNLVITGTAGNFTLAFTPTSLTAATSNPFALTAGAATKLAYTTVPSTGTAGTPFSVTIQSQDANGNPASVTSSTTITLSKSTGAGSLSGTLTGTISSGSSSVTIATPVYSAADIMTLTASATSGMTGLTAVTSGNITFSAGALDHFAISTISSPQTAGTAITGISLTAKDANNNTVTSFTGTVTYTGTAGITGTSPAFTAGQLTGVSVTPTNVGTGMTLIVTGSTKTGSATFDVVSACTAGTWLGTTSTDWNIGTNWCGGTVPTASTAVVIPASGTNWPTLSTSQTGNCSSLTFSGAVSKLNFTGGNLVVAGNVSFTAGIINSTTSASTLSVGGSWTGTGTTFTPSTFLTVDFTGATQTIPQLVSNYYNLTLSGSGTKTIGITTGTINGNFTLNGSFTANSGGAQGDGLIVAGDLSLTGSSILNMSNATQGITVNGNVSVGAGSQFNLQNGTSNSIGGTFTVDGAFTRSVANSSGSLGISGTTTINNGGSFTVSTYCSLTFNGLLTINNGGSYSNSTTTGVVLKGGITNGSSGTFTAGTGIYTFNTNSQEINGILAIPNVTINANAILTITSSSALTVSGTLTNSVGNGGLVLQSDATGTASLIHSSADVPATVQRYITGSAEAWHFLSSPVSTQAISGDWLPSGTYGGTGGTGYDLYLWNEPTSCWIYKLNTTATVNWTTVHSSANFVVGRGYLYSVQATNPTKTFAGTLNTGDLNYAITSTTVTPENSFKGFNLVGNPYPSSIDWQASSGWTRTNLTTSGSGYDMWIYNPATSNYGVINSASGTGTNSVTRYIAPMQGFFVLAASSGTLGMTNAIRVANGASDWKSTSFDPDVLSITVASEQNSGSDEARLLFGYPQNQEGAPKLFSPATTAPSLYLAEGTKNYTLRYLSDTLVNREVAVLFKPGTTGRYTLTFDFNPALFKTVILEDRQAKTIQNLNSQSTYQFSATAADQPNRFMLHFAPIKADQILELPAKISSDGNHILVDLTQVDQSAHVAIYDILGRKVYEQQLGSNSQHLLNFNPTKTLLVVKLNNQQGEMVRKVWCNNSSP